METLILTPKTMRINPMKKENVKRFVSQFEAIHSAVSLLSELNDCFITKWIEGEITDMSNYDNSSAKNKFLDRYQNDVAKCKSISEDSHLTSNAIEEIEDNLYSLPDEESRKRYVKNIIRLFTDYVPYFDFTTNTGTDLTEISSFEKRVPGAKYTLNIINSWCNGKVRFRDLNVVEQYVLNSFNTLMEFSCLFDAKCLSFNIDIQQLQKEINIYVQRHRDTAYLYSQGFTFTNDSSNVDFIVNEINVLKLYEEYGEFFANETLDQWKERFKPLDLKLLPIEIENKATENSNKVTLLGILKAIQDTTNRTIDFDLYVKNRWGILNFSKTISDHKEKEGFKKSFATTKRILIVKK